MPRKIMYVGYLKNENEKNKETAQKQKLSATECSTIEHSFQLLTRRSPVRYLANHRYDLSQSNGKA